MRYQEPTTPWWTTTRVHLEDHRRNAAALDADAADLAARNTSTHRVPAAAIRAQLARFTLNVQET